MPSLTSSEFSAATGLSRKALRLYAANGLLSPAYINPHNNYKYYSPAHVSIGKQIFRLRRAGYDIQNIRRLIQGSKKPASYESMIVGVEQKLVELRAFRHTLMTEQIHALRDPNFMSITRHFIGKTIVLHQSEVCGFVQKTVESLKSHVSDLSKQTIFGLYSEIEDDRVKTTAGIFVSGDEGLRSGRYEYGIIELKDTVAITVDGPHEGYAWTDAVDRRLELFAASHGRRISASTLEVYPLYRHNTASTNDFQTTVFMNTELFSSQR